MAALTSAPAAASPVPAIRDTDWSLIVTASSSELQAVGTTHVLLRLTVDKPEGTSEYVHLGARHHAPHCTRVQEKKWPAPAPPF